MSTQPNSQDCSNCGLNVPEGAEMPPECGCCKLVSRDATLYTRWVPKAPKPVRLYLAGPMSGLPELNFPAFHAEAARLRAKGFDVVNPAEIDVNPSHGWEACMRADIAQLVTCDAIALLPGWTKSRGARLEHYIAGSLGMKVIVLAAQDGEPAGVAA